MARRKQLTFDIDTSVVKQILGDQNYTKVYKDIQKFMERAGWQHIEGSVYMSSRPMDHGDVAYMIRDMKKEYPYLEKCVKEMHQTDISKVHSLNQYFDYDGTPGKYEQTNDQCHNRQEETHKKSPPEKASVLNKLNRNKEIIKEREKEAGLGERKRSYDRNI